ncbi:hypothetical protein Nmel_008516 [Mimus melanotis]
MILTKNQIYTLLRPQYALWQPPLQAQKKYYRQHNTRPPPYAMSHLANDYEDMLLTEPEPERFIHRCPRRALQEGDMEFLQAMPVIYCNQNSHNEQLSYEMVKELRKSVKENSLHSSDTVNLINAIAESHTMFPVDWKSF